MSPLRILVSLVRRRCTGMYDDFRRGSGMFGAFLFGGLIGAVLGILFAPRSGQQTRGMLASKGQEYLDQGKELYEDGRERLVEAYDSGRDVASEKTDELRAKIDETRERLLEQVGEGAEGAKDKVEDARKGAREAVNKGASAARKGVDVGADKTQAALDLVAAKSAEFKADDKAEVLPETKTE